MFQHLFQHLNEQQRSDGAVDHPEFEVTHGIGATKLSADERSQLEGFVLGKTSEAHRYMSAKGKQGIVYYDRRGRGAMCALEAIADDELMWLAQQKGWKKPANPDPGDSEGGYDYQPPIEEAKVEGNTDEIERVLSEARAGTEGQQEYMRGAEAARHTALVTKNHLVDTTGLTVGGWVALAKSYLNDIPEKPGPGWLKGFLTQLGAEKMSVKEDWDENDVAVLPHDPLGPMIGDEMIPFAFIDIDQLPVAYQSITPEDIQVINPYAAGMWVIRFEDLLYKLTKKKWKWKKPVLKSGNELRYKWGWARRDRGKFFTPLVQLVITYDHGRDLFDVSVEEYDDDMNKVREKKMRGMYIGDVTDPEKMLGWMRRT